MTLYCNYYHCIISLMIIVMITMNHLMYLGDCNNNNNNKKRDLYSVLGLIRSASNKEIKRAYRQKARETHPDKRQGDPEAAVLEFREVVEAFETLSDESARRIYDSTGQTLSEQANPRNFDNNNNFNQGGGYEWTWQWRHQQFNQQQYNQRQYNPNNHHRFMFDWYRRKQILDAQSRVISVRPSMKQLRTVLFTDWDGDQDLLDRYALIAFYDSNNNECSNRLFNQILYPWPFAGFSSVEGSKIMGIWWEDLLMTVKMDITSNRRTLYDVMELVDKFGLDMISSANGGLELRVSSCPSIVLLQRGDSFEKKSKARIFKDYDGFSDWVWQQLKVKVTLWNRTPWPLDLWWLDGLVGKKQGDAIKPDEKFRLDTYLSHSFFARAQHVTGNSINNESGLFWLTVGPNDDQKVFEIHSRCFDASGECPRWKAEGFCDRSRETFFTRQNPTFRDWVIHVCEVSCQTGCGAPRQKQNVNGGTF